MIAHMPSMNEQSFSVPAWGVSFALHGGVVWLAVLFTAQVKPVLTEEVFKWEVALVERVNTESAPQTTPEAAQAVVPPAQAPPVVTRRPVEPPPDTATHRVAPQQTAQMVHPDIQPAKPLEQREEPPPIPTVESSTPVAKL
ncbi:MAG TPA: hypothetical protein VF019_08900, partial [Nitrospira sp.]